MSTSLPSRLDEEVIVVRRVGVEIGALAADRDLAQQAGPLELVQRVVDGRQRHALAGPHGLLVQHFRRHVPVAVAEQQRRQRHALARRPQARPAKQFADVDRRRRRAPAGLSKFADIVSRRLCAQRHGNSSHNLPTRWHTSSIYRLGRGLQRRRGAAFGADPWNAGF